MDTKWKALIVIYLGISLAVGYLFVSKIFFTPKVSITYINYDIVNRGSGNNQIFIGSVKNTGQAVAYDTWVYVTWKDFSGASYTGSYDIGVLNPNQEEQFKVEFNEEGLAMIQYYTQWAEFSSNPS